MIVEREEGKRAIGIEQVRSATRFLQQTALYGERKLLLVQEADLMTPAAANSLLKTPGRVPRCGRSRSVRYLLHSVLIVTRLLS